MRLTGRTNPYCVLQVELSYEEFLLLHEAHNEIVEMLEAIDPEALATMGGHNGVARALLVTAMEDCKEEREGEAEYNPILAKAESADDDSRKSTSGMSSSWSSGRAHGLREALEIMKAQPLGTSTRIRSTGRACGQRETLEIKKAQP
jgi:hypothetical protein